MPEAEGRPANEGKHGQVWGDKGREGPVILLVCGPHTLLLAAPSGPAGLGVGSLHAASLCRAWLGFLSPWKGRDAPCSIVLSHQSPEPGRGLYKEGLQGP